MIKYCIIPDVHGRTFWKKAKEDANNYDKIIFLGDYVDPYVEYDGISREDAFVNFIEIIDFANKDNSKVNLLVGNHDLHYFPNVSEEWGCRRDNQRYEDIQDIFMDNIGLFKACEVIGTDTYGKVLLTHAGVNKKYFECYIHGEFNDDNDFIRLFNEILTNPSEINRYLWRIGYMRGGYDRAGSFVWSDIDEHDVKNTHDVNEAIGVDYQIFAHTYAFPSPNDIYECESYAMIDNKQLFEVY